MAKYGWETARLSELLGQTLRSVRQIDNDQLVFETDRSVRYRLFHNGECCEEVTIEDVVGDLDDLVGSPILMTEEVTNIMNPKPDSEERQSSFTWTFYKFATVKGYVTVRWYGESNGYYSESVDFERCLS